MLEINLLLADALNDDWSFERFLSLRGKVLRQVANRTTMRVELAEKTYYLKIHRGCGWGEVLKNLLLFRLPVIGAQTEVAAVKRVRSLGVDTLSIAAFGWQGFNPAKCESFILTRAIEPSISLETLCHPWPTCPPDIKLKRSLIRQVAAVARTLHENGVNHRDFYLCHFLVDSPVFIPTEGRDEKPGLHLIDLHRTQVRRTAPERWRIKDLAGLYFSSLDIGLTGRDVLRFLSEYRQQPVRTTLQRDHRRLRKTELRAIALYRKTHGCAPRLPALSFAGEK